MCKNGKFLNMYIKTCGFHVPTTHELFDKMQNGFLKKNPQDMYAKCLTRCKHNFMVCNDCTINTKWFTNIVSWYAMIPQYTQNGQQNIVSWSTMIARYAQNGFLDKIPMVIEG